MNTTLPQLGPGTVVTGKWTKNRVEVKKKLGEGANGAVYLVTTPVGAAAMKVCSNAGDVAMEWGLLEAFGSGGRALPKPMFIDDAEQPAYFFFYIMEWVPGSPLHELSGHLGPEQIYRVLRGMTEGLSPLHQNQQAFCDVKPQNVLVQLQPKITVKFVDVGGVTPFGRSVRQYTPFSDRAFWGFGTRTADTSYDLCGICLALLCITPPGPPMTLANQPPGVRSQWLEKAMKRFPIPAFTDVFRRTFEGVIRTDAEFVQALDEAYARHQERVRAKPAQKAQVQSSPRGPKQAVPHPPVSPPATRQKRGRHRRRDWTEWLMWSSLSASAVVTFLAWADYLGWLP